TMKSPPGRSVVSTSTVGDGSVSRAGVGADADAGAALCACGSAFATPGTNAAAPVTAALFRKPRRSTECWSDMGASLHLVGPWEITPGLKDPAYTVRNRLATV